MVAIALWFGKKAPRDQLVLINTENKLSSALDGNSVMLGRDEGGRGVWHSLHLAPVEALCDSHRPSNPVGPAMYSIQSRHTFQLFPGLALQAPDFSIWLAVAPAAACGPRRMWRAVTAVMRTSRVAVQLPYLWSRNQASCRGC